MFGKKKKEPKVEQIFGNENSDEHKTSDSEENNKTQNSAELETKATGVDEIRESSDKDLKEMFGEEAFDSAQDVSLVDENLDDNLTEEQKEKYQQLGSLRDKISQILKSSNVEIIDENIGDEYIVDAKADSKKRQQEDYDSLKALFGSEKGRKQELTLTIDDFDYTYVGQYVEEYDIMHLKNIKKIHLKRKKPKGFALMVAAACAVVVIGLGIFLGIFLTRETPVYLMDVSLNQTENSYFIGESFDYAGLYLTATYSDGTTEKIALSADYLTDIVGLVDQTTLEFTGGKAATLKFTYGGIVVEYTVNIKEKTISGLSAIYTEELFSMSSGGYISNSNLILICHYSTTDSSGTEVEYSQEFLDLSAVSLAVGSSSLTYSSNGFLCLQSTNHSSKITITYAGYILEITYDSSLDMVTSTTLIETETAEE